MSWRRVWKSGGASMAVCTDAGRYDPYRYRPCGPNPNRPSPDQHSPRSGRALAYFLLLELNLVTVAYCAQYRRSVALLFLSFCCQRPLCFFDNMPPARSRRLSEEDILETRISDRLRWLMQLVFPRVPLCTQAALSVPVRPNL